MWIGTDSSDHRAVQAGTIASGSCNFTMEICCSAMLLDLDGVPVDSRAAAERTWRLWSGRHGLSPETVLAIAHGRTARDVVEALAPNVRAAGGQYVPSRFFLPWKFTPVFTPTAASTTARRVVGILMQGVLRRRRFAASAPTSHVIPPPIQTTRSLRRMPRSMQNDTNAKSDSRSLAWFPAHEPPLRDRRHGPHGQLGLRRVG